MWKRGGQSCALDRAEALLSAKRNSRGAGASTHGSPAKTRGFVDGSIKTRPAPQNAHILLSDLSDLSSLSSAPDHGANTFDFAPHDKKQGTNEASEDLRPPSSLGGGGSRFLKKAPPAVTNSSQSPVSRSHVQQMPESRYAPSSQRGSQTAALSRLAQIESRFRSRKQPQGPDASQNLTSDLGISPPPEAVTQSLEASVPMSAASSSDQSLKEKRFLKNKEAAAVDTTNPAASSSASPKSHDAGVMSRSRAVPAAGPAMPLVGLETMTMRVAHGLSLESDEEDMRKLLGDSLDSTDNSFLRAKKKPDKKSRQKVHSTPPSAAVQPLSSNAAPPRSPASTSSRSSPFRFTGQAQAHFSPSALSPSPSPPCVSPSLSRRLSSPRRSGSPQRSVSSMSGRSEVLSLEELFPVQPPSEELQSDMSVVSSEDFKVNVMSLDDLMPASPGFTEETPGKQKEKHNPPASGSRERHKEQQQQQQEEEEEVLDYQSDFESESRTMGNYSASQVSEQLPGDGVGEEAVSEVRDEASLSDVSHGRTEDDYSSTFSDSSRSRVSRTSDRSDASEPLSRSRDSRSSASRGGKTSSEQRRAAATRVLKEAAVQTQPERMAYSWSTGVTYMPPTSVAVHTLSAEPVEALSSYNPAVFVLNEILKQQLAATRLFIESSRHLHSSVVRSLEPPNYKYTTLEDTKEYIRRHRAPSLMQERTDYR